MNRTFNCSVSLLTSCSGLWEEWRQGTKLSHNVTGDFLIRPSSFSKICQCSEEWKLPLLSFTIVLVLFDENASPGFNAFSVWSAVIWDSHKLNGRMRITFMCVSVWQTTFQRREEKRRMNFLFVFDAFVVFGFCACEFQWTEKLPPNFSCCWSSCDPAGGETRAALSSGKRTQETDLK